MWKFLYDHQKIPGFSPRIDFIKVGPVVLDAITSFLDVSG
jgi:hypothetical protein